jgi:carbonic anhydrase
MELHLLHQNNVTKQFVVVAVFMETPYPFSATNTTVESLQALNSSLDVGENAFLKTVGINNIAEYPQAYDVHGLINVADILPNNGTGLDYWTYPGSLTIPPCTEQVQWFVVQQVITISENQRRDVGR